MARRSVLPILVFAAATGAGIALADIAPDPEYGQSLSPRERTSVAMTKETVTVTLGKKGARVRAVFTLKNTGQATSLEVGFPDVAQASSHGSDDPPGDFSGYKLHDFAATVDGAAVEHGYKWVRNQESPREKAEIEAKIRELKENLEKAGDAKARERIERDLNWQQRRLEQWAWYGWLVWDMKFEAGQERRVEVSYGVPYRPPYRPTLLQEANFEYVLKTGALWKDPIGRALIEVKFADGLTAKNFASASPSGYAESGEGLTWDLKDVEPEEDVRIRLNLHADYGAATRAYLAMAEEALGKGDKNAGAHHLAWAAECQEKAEAWAECIESCRKIVVLEKEARRCGHRGANYVRTWWKAGYVPWECRIVECFRKLGKTEEAKKAAAEALAACRALLESDDRSLRFGLNRDGIAKRITELEALLAE